MGFLDKIFKPVKKIVGEVTDFLGFGIGDAAAGVAQVKGAEKDREHQEKLFRENWAMQKEFAKHGLRWRVQDAVAAGLHPLIGAGVQPSSGSPVYAGETGFQQAFGRIGQDIGRAWSAKATPGERALGRIKLQQEQETLKNMELRNIALAKEIWQLDPAPTQTSPAMPTTMGTPLQRELGIVGQGDMNGVKFQDNPIIKSQKMGLQTGTKALSQPTVDEHGRLYQLPTQDASEAINEGFYHQLIYLADRIADMFRNAPVGDRAAMLRIQRARPRAPRGYQYRYEIFPGRFRLVKQVSKDDDQFYYNRAFHGYPYWVKPIKKYR